jgi:hypothetical protein
MLVAEAARRPAAGRSSVARASRHETSAGIPAASLRTIPKAVAHGLAPAPAFACSQRSDSISARRSPRSSSGSPHV